jgi:AICAR transformylase/IMP cyclohydrolase PurH
MKITRALISVSNKKGVASFARALEKQGVDIPLAARPTSSAKKAFQSATSRASPIFLKCSRAA